MWTLPQSVTRKKPLYRQVIELIEEHIHSGLISAGQRLPSERRLSELLGVDRSTVIHALNELTDKGVLIRKVGSGTFVNPHKWQLQTYPILNWSSLAQEESDFEQNEYQLKVNHLRKNAAQSKLPLIDLASGDIASDLLPEQTFPEFSWQALCIQEQDDETARLGLYTLRETVQRHLQQKLQLQVNLEQILITSGAQQALFLISQTLLKPGDAVGIEAPSYFYLLPIFQAAGLRVHPLPIDAHGVMLDSLIEQVETKKIKMIFLNPVFQNPTGYVMDAQRKKALLQYCAYQHIPIVEDDAYSLLYFHSHTDVTPLKKYDKQQQVIYIGSLSKYIGKNIRVGWLVAPKAIVHKLANIRQQIDAGLSVLPQLLAQHYLLYQIEQHSLLLRNQLKQRAQLLEQWLAARYKKQLIFDKPKGGLFLYAQYIENKADKHLQALLNELLAHNIVVMQGKNFGDARATLRLNYAHFLGVL